MVTDNDGESLGKGEDGSGLVEIKVGGGGLCNTFNNKYWKRLFLNEAICQHRHSICIVISTQ